MSETADPGLPAIGQIVWIARTEGGSLPYRVTDVRHEPGSGLWTHDLEPVAQNDPALLASGTAAD